MLPPKYPEKARSEILLVYHKKSIFSIPMAATPAADPIIKILPPVPAAYARKIQKELSIGMVCKSYIAMDAATSGTLSITAEPRPITNTMRLLFPKVLSKS